MKTQTAIVFGVVAVLIFGALCFWGGIQCGTPKPGATTIIEKHDTTFVPSVETIIKPVYRTRIEARTETVTIEDFARVDALNRTIDSLITAGYGWLDIVAMCDTTIDDISIKAEFSFFDRAFSFPEIIHSHSDTTKTLIQSENVTLWDYVKRAAPWVLAAILAAKQLGIF